MLMKMKTNHIHRCNKRSSESPSPTLLLRNHHQTSHFTKSADTKDCINTGICLAPWYHRAELEPNSENRGSCYVPESEPVIGTFQVGRFKCSKKTPKVINQCSESPPISMDSKKDQVSNSEGMSGLRRLLFKENSNASLMKREDRTKEIKKSPSAGSMSSYWSKISNPNQPSFFRRIFDKVTPNSNGTIVKDKQSSLSQEPKLEVDVDPIEVDGNPVLAMNVAQKASHFMKLEHSQRFSKWRNLESGKQKAVMKVKDDNSDFPENGYQKTVEDNQAPFQKPETQALPNQGMPFPNENVEEKVVNPEPSRLSLKDRVRMFNKLSTAPTTVSLNLALADEVSRRNHGASSFAKPSPRGSGSCSSLNHRITSSTRDTESNYDNLTAFPLFRNHSTKDFPSMVLRNYGAVLRKEEQPRSEPIPLSNRNTSSKGTFMSHVADELSEDGEVSSGGMEVAEIISKSYENSPMARKKASRVHKAQPGLLPGDIWRKSARFGDNIAHWSATTELPEASLYSSRGSHFAKVSESFNGEIKGSQTSTSNLLPILTALSSSDDQLHDQLHPTVGAFKSRSMTSMMSPPPPPRTKKLARESTEMRNKLRRYCEANASCSGEDLSEKNRSKNETMEVIDFSDISRGGDPLIIKKHIPVLCRKPSGGKFKNPLKALAARMDFNRSPN